MDQPESDREGDLPHPRETTALHGHADAERALARSYASGRLPPAWLLGGPRGLGKATLAYRFARVLMAARTIDPEVPEPLGMALTAPAFRLVAAQSHPDLLVLKRPWDDRTKRFKTQIPVEDVRRIHGLFGHRAGRGTYRVCIVDAADDLGPSAANALLKTLEEPPPGGIFLLISHAPARLLPTIRSRCRRLMLKPLAPQEVEGLLAARVPEVSPQDRQLLARLAAGNPGRALTLAVNDGLSLYRDLMGVLEGFPRFDVGRVHAIAEQLARPAAEPAYETTLELLFSIVNRLMHRSAGIASEIGVEQENLARLAQSATLEHWAGVWEKITGLAARADALSLDKRQVMLGCFRAMVPATG